MTRPSPFAPVLLFGLVLAACGTDPTPTPDDASQATDAGLNPVDCPSFPGLPGGPCNGFCTGFNSPAHCGACNRSCAAGMRCVLGHVGPYCDR